MAETTEDGRYIVVDGRRWRATDPSIPEPLPSRTPRRAAPLAEGDLGVVDPGPGVVAAVAGEGADGGGEAVPEAGGAPEGTTGPSDAARAIGGERWRSLMDTTRAVARVLAGDGDIEITQGGEPIDPAAPWIGPVRVRVAT